MGLSSCSSLAQQCGSWAQLLPGMGNLPGPGMEPVSLALQAGFLEKPLFLSFNKKVTKYFYSPSEAKDHLYTSYLVIMRIVITYASLPGVVLLYAILSLQV